jgi:hypothetical protein
VSGLPSDPQLHIRSGKPTLVFREGTALYVAEWTGTQWIIVGSGTVASTMVIRSVVAGDRLFVLIMNPSGAAPRITVDVFDGTQWGGYPGGIEAAGSTLTDVDVAVHQGAPVVGLVEGGKVKARLFVSSPELGMIGPSAVRGSDASVRIRD